MKGMPTKQSEEMSYEELKGISDEQLEAMSSEELERIPHKLYILRIVDKKLNRLAHSRKTKLNKLMTARTKECREYIETLPS